MVTSAEMSWTAREGGARIRGQGGGGNRPLRFWKPYLNLGGYDYTHFITTRPPPLDFQTLLRPWHGEEAQEQEGPSQFPV